ncbi:hypothetical protein BH11PSE13_BH11PSE13_28070 [soil metagenome]
MGVTCPACGTENRSVAKFCIECIGSLPTIFAATEILPHMPHMPHMPQRSQAVHRTPFVREPAIREDAEPGRASGFIAAAAAATVASAAPTGPQTASVSSGVQRNVEVRKGLWVSVAAFAIALVIGAAGWLVAGAGGLYIYAFGHSGSTGETELAVVTAPPAMSAVQAAPSAPAVIAATPNIAAARSPVTPTLQTTAATAATAAATSTPTSPPARTTAKPTTSTQVRAGRATAAADPTAQCTGLGFFATSRCMATQCAKADYSAHPTCAALLAQQRVMEEKRNPTMAN